MCIRDRTYIARLVAKGYKVAICEQMEDPALAKGIVKRSVIRVITPGTCLLYTSNQRHTGGGHHGNQKIVQIVGIHRLLRGCVGRDYIISVGHLHRPHQCCHPRREMCIRDSLAECDMGYTAKWAFGLVSIHALLAECDRYTHGCRPRFPRCV